MIGTTIAVYVFGAWVYLILLLIGFDNGKPTDGALFRIVFWPVDVCRVLYRSFKNWKTI